MKNIYELHVDLLRQMYEWHEQVARVAIHEAVNCMAERNRFPEIKCLIDCLEPDDPAKFLLTFCMATVNFPVRRRELVLITENAIKNQYPEEAFEIMDGLK